jgi:cold shock CspA family protein
MTDERRFGKVKRWNEASAYGFLAEDGSATQHFFHINDIRKGDDEPRVGQRVSFELGINRRNSREQAMNVEFVGEEHRTLADQAFMQADRD